MLLAMGAKSARLSIRVEPEILNALARRAQPLERVPDVLRRLVRQALELPPELPPERAPALPAEAKTAQASESVAPIESAGHQPEPEPAAEAPALEPERVKPPSVAELLAQLGVK